MRERGLKCAGAYGKKTPFGRSREGAWIEIQSTRIVICSVGGRSRKGAWIEINGVLDYILKSEVAPVRERGLKCVQRIPQWPAPERRSRKGTWIEIRNTVGFSVLLTQITHSD